MIICFKHILCQRILQEQCKIKIYKGTKQKTANTIDVLINEIEENNHNYRTRKTSLTILWLN